MTNLDDQGATPRELLLEAARRNNTDLLMEVLETNSTAEFLNNSTDALGNTALHIAAKHGSYDVIDELLDIEGVEVDPANTLEKNTPLHEAVQLAKDNEKLCLDVVNLLVEAGADPRILNKHRQKPIQIVEPTNTELRAVLRDGEYFMNAGDDIVNEDNDEPAGSGSESD